MCYVDFIKFASFFNIIYLNFEMFINCSQTTGAHIYIFLFTMYDYYVSNMEIINIRPILK